MRPQVSSLPPAARLLARPVVPPCPRTVCGVRNYAQTTSARTGSLYSELSRPALSLDNRRSVQKRWITQAYIQRMKDAEKEWQETAKEITAGKKKSFVEHLEERGLLHDVVGYVEFVLVALLLCAAICREVYRLTGPVLQFTENAITYTIYSRIRELACMLG